MPSVKTHVGRIRILGVMEGSSFLLLVGIAMPLKYFAGFPAAVQWVGWIHGLLFIAYSFAVLFAQVNGALSFGKSVAAFIAALLPFGPFIFDRKLAEDEAREKAVS